jgi:hypothetical protein
MEFLGDRVISGATILYWPVRFGNWTDQFGERAHQASVRLEIIGQGAVTVVDGSSAISNIREIAPRATIKLIDVRLHVLPSGTRMRRVAGPDNAVGADGAEPAPAALRRFLAALG